jgi:hypothetical protein
VNKQLATRGKSMAKDTSAGARIVGRIVSLLAIGLGGWLLFMAWRGASPEEVLDPAGRLIFGIFGLLLGAPGLCMLIHTFMPDGRFRKLLEAAGSSSSLFLAGLTFFMVGILKPSEIGSTLSIGGHAIPVLSGISIGAIVFVLVGIGLMSAARGIYKSVLQSPTSPSK